MSQPETPATPAPPAPPAPPSPPAVDWAAEAARQSKEYAEAVNKRVADRLAQKKRDLEARTQEESADAFSLSPKVLVDQGGVSVVQEDGRTIIKKDGKTIVNVPSKSSRERSSSANNPEVPIVFIVFLFLFLIVKTIMGPINRRRAGNLPANPAGPGPGLSADDSATLQKIHRTVGQMERRVEALETILADPRRTAAFTTVTRPSTTSSPSTSYESKV